MMILCIKEGRDVMRGDSALLERLDDPQNADAYQKIVSGQVLPGIAARRLDGYPGAYLLRRDLDNEVEFATVMIFDSLDHVRAFDRCRLRNGLRPGACCARRTRPLR